MSDTTTSQPQSSSSATSSSQPQQSKQKRPPAYGEIQLLPSQEAIDGIRFDFNYGIRVYFPKQLPAVYRIVFKDLDTGTVMYNAETKPDTVVTSVKHYYIRYRLELYKGSDPKPAFTHDMDLADKDVMIQFPVNTLGDSIAWFSYVERFQQRHKCRILCVMTPWIADLVRRQYPDITFINKEDTKKHSTYAAYYLGLFFKDNINDQPVDFRQVGLHRTAGYILGLRGPELADEPPRFDLSAPRKIKEKYVCIAAQSSSQAKYWNNPLGWMTVVDFLKKQGYRVLCVDKAKVYGMGMQWNQIPYGAEDFTGDLPIQERVDLIKDADFFIGLSSGLSWVAWGCRVPVVLISGFTEAENEFYTPYRVISYHGCNGCWNDMRYEFDHDDFLWCPVHKDDDRRFECTRLISPEYVIQTIKKIPTFQPAKDV